MKAPRLARIVVASDPRRDFQHVRARPVRFDCLVPMASNPTWLVHTIDGSVASFIGLSPCRS